ncbi:glycosyltransferase family 4 protein [Telmatobacter sp. DSM 110680]|uniref:Glycosyltransferase family 4 protein n=1 Tax=Telmatobacter sp. DSM 110680 TaxID=3036704 RepID=A0AAU7DE45_9BACT
MPKIKKVLIIVENMSVPFDDRVWKEATTLRSSGYQVSVLCPRGYGSTATYELLEGVHIYRHPMPAEGNSALGFIWEFGWALIWEFIFAWWIFARRGFQVIQGCNPPDNIFLVALPFKLVGVKYIFDHHDVVPELYQSKFGQKGVLYRIQVMLEALTYRFSNVVMATNESYRQLAITRGHRDPQNVFVVRNGPDLVKFKAVQPNPNLKYGKPYLVGYVGNMSTQEGLELLIEAAQHIKESGRQDVHFTCVGGGPGLATLRKMVEDLHLEDVMNFTGRVPVELLLEILSTADVCVNPDKPCAMNDMSTMIKIMEYMALAKPIVQFDLKEGRYSAENASLYCENDKLSVGLAEKILWLLDNPEERKAMGERGRERVVKDLAWEHSVPNLLAAYERAFSDSSGGEVTAMPKESESEERCS